MFIYKEKVLLRISDPSNNMYVAISKILGNPHTINYAMPVIACEVIERSYPFNIESVLFKLFISPHPTDDYEGSDDDSSKYLYVKTTIS